MSQSNYYPYQEARNQGFGFPQGYGTGQQGQGQGLPGSQGAAPGQFFGQAPTQPGYGTQAPYIQPGGNTQPTAPSLPGQLPLEASYIENILRLNKGKLATVYTTFENNREWNAKIFKGLIEAAGRDHLILSDPQTGQRYLIPMIYLDYVTFDEEIEYEYPYAAGAPNLTSYPPR